MQRILCFATCALSMMLIAAALFWGRPAQAAYTDSCINAVLFAGGKTVNLFDPLGGGTPVQASVVADLNEYEFTASDGFALDSAVNEMRVDFDAYSLTITLINKQGQEGVLTEDLSLSVENPLWESQLPAIFEASGWFENEAWSNLIGWFMTEDSIHFHFQAGLMLPAGETLLQFHAPLKGKAVYAYNNRVLDGGFEAGALADIWGAHSNNFESPITDQGQTNFVGSESHSGDWWAWLGGNTQEGEFAVVEQEIQTQESEQATLQFYLEIPQGQVSGMLQLFVDDIQVFSVTEKDVVDYPRYKLVTLDVHPHSDGAAHVLRFEGTISGEGDTSFFIDDVYWSESAGLIRIADELIADFGVYDKNNNEGLHLAEAQVSIPTLTQATFAQIDANGDGMLTQQELEDARNSEMPRYPCFGCRTWLGAASTGGGSGGDGLLLMGVCLILFSLSFVRARRHFSAAQGK